MEKIGESEKFERVRNSQLRDGLGRLYDLNDYEIVSLVLDRVAFQLRPCLQKGQGRTRKTRSDRK